MFLLQWLDQLRAIPMSARSPKISNKELDQLQSGLLMARMQMRCF